MIFHNKKDYGCGLFAVVNVLELSELVTQERLELSKKQGNTAPQLNNFLANYGGLD